MRPLFVARETRPPPGVLSVDGAVPGAAMTYSHWQGDPPLPVELAADTGTGIALRAAADARRWLAPYPTVCINHLDADGLLSVLTVCRPELALAHAPLLLDAARAGDFTAWPGPAGFDLMLRLHQVIRDVRAGEGIGRGQRCLDTVVERADELLAGPWPGADERAAATAQAEAAIVRLRAAPPPVHGRLAVVAWRRVLGHAPDAFLGIHQPDDLPLIALSTVIAPHCFQLLLEETADGVVVQLDAPRHAWARTRDLPAVPWPELAPLAAALAARDPSVDWLTRPEAQAVAFTCVLAGARDTRPAPCRLSPAELLAVCSPFFA